MASDSNEKVEMTVRNRLKKQSVELFVMASKTFLITGIYIYIYRLYGVIAGNKRAPFKNYFVSFIEIIEIIILILLKLKLLKWRHSTLIKNKLLDKLLWAIPVSAYWLVTVWLRPGHFMVPRPHLWVSLSSYHEFNQKLEIKYK